jgi:alkyldihydroxyacetonephosphate synthase
LNSILQSEYIKSDFYERLIHTYGKSFRDLWRIRNGIISHTPDLVCYPQSEEHVQAIINAANQFDVVVIPFGGGSNIAGCVEPREHQGRMVLSLDMKYMNRVIEVDRYSMLARIQAGSLGPDMEKQLNEHGMTLGHFPDSFEYSSIGGWVATRSAGMQSDKYGKIEDMVIALRMVTPRGVIVTRTVPKSSNGIGINHLCVGSEGILGVITEVTVQVHRIPAKKEFHGYLFPSFEKGIAAIYEASSQNVMPSMTRLNDADKTALSFAYKTKSSFFQDVVSRGIKFYLKYIKKLNMEQVCLMLVAFEGNDIPSQLKKINGIYKKMGGLHLGTSPGKAFEKAKFDFPYFRDFIMDYGISADVAETATTWKNILPLYYDTQKAIKQAIVETGSLPWCGCHMSHTYKTGASLYFTFAFKQSNDVIKQYLHVKKAAEDAFIRFGGTFSHHHAVGWEHAPWMIDDISMTGVEAIQGVKATLDPKNIMNPGKLIPGNSSLIDWGWQ